MFFCYDKPLSPDLQTLLEAVALLDISEFRLFELAYQKWYGRAAPAEQLEEEFAHYMFGDEVPFWVRHYARDVLDLAGQFRSGECPLEPSPQPATRAGVRRGLRIFLGLIFLLVFLIVVTSFSPEWMLFGDECYFPPCY